MVDIDIMISQDKLGVKGIGIRHLIPDSGITFDDPVDRFAVFTRVFRPELRGLPPGIKKIPLLVNDYILIRVFALFFEAGQVLHQRGQQIIDVIGSGCIMILIETELTEKMNVRDKNPHPVIEWKTYPVITIFGYQLDVGDLSQTI
jgi:hypothetical protein